LVVKGWVNKLMNNKLHFGEIPGGSISNKAMNTTLQQQLQHHFNAFPHSTMYKPEWIYSTYFRLNRLQYV